jgi:hypothetical protein
MAARKIKGSADSRVMISRLRSEGMCVHTATYQLLSIMQEPLVLKVKTPTAEHPVPMEWTATEAHSPDRECFFSDIALLQKLGAQMDGDAMRLYRIMEDDTYVAEDLAQQVNTGRVQ